MRIRTVPIQASERSGWGGARKGSGPKRKTFRRNVRHEKREPFNKTSICHVTLRMAPDVPTLRTKRRVRAIENVFRAKKAYRSMSLVHYSVQGDHLHLVVEVDSHEDLAKGMQSLKGSMAHRLNAFFGRSGSLFADRYHVVLVRGVNQTRNVMNYVLKNAQKHGIQIPDDELDPGSSARFYKGFWGRLGEKVTKDSPVMPPRSWYLMDGPYMIGGISTRYTPPLCRRV